MKCKFDDFQLGDTVTFSKVFTTSDFADFSILSGDQNPFHHDVDYAKAYGEGHTIVPFHLIISPLSKIAGMSLPGEPSLYLSHSLRAVNSLIYGEAITYSAKIVEIYYTKRVMKISVVGFVGSKVIFDGHMYTHSRHANWMNEFGKLSKKGFEKNRVLITGASGEIAQSIAQIFKKNGYPLLLQTRSISNKISDFVSNSKETNIEVIEAEIGEASGLEQLCSKISAMGDIGTIIHTASPPVDSCIEDLVRVNYSALKVICEEVLPNMLRHQHGNVMLIGSTAILTQAKEIEDYSAAKVLATNYVSGINTSYSSYGVSGKVLAPDFVETEYSKHLRGTQASLLPAEVGKIVFDIIENGGDFLTLQYVDSVVRGAFGFSPNASEIENTIYSGDLVGNYNHDNSQQSLHSELVSCISKILPNLSKEEIQNGGLGLVQGWDSLAQIQILLEVEKKLEFKFSSSDYSGLKTFQGIYSVLDSRKQF